MNKKKFFYNKKNCRLCGSKKLNIFLNLKQSPIGDNYTQKKNKSQLIPLKLMNCRICNFKQLSHVVDEKKVYGDYLYTTSTSYGLKKHFKNSFNFLKNFHPNLSKNDYILDIGSNDGSNLEIFKSDKFKTIGIEPAKVLCRLSRKKKILTINNFFNQKVSNLIKNRYGKPKIICIYNLLSNIDNLGSFFDNLNNLIDDETIISIESFSLIGIVEKNLFDHIYHEHLSYFQIEPLIKFLKKYGLNILYSEYNQIKGSSMKILIGKNLDLVNNKSINSCIRLEKKIRVNEISSFSKINKQNLKFTKDFNKKVKILKINKLAGYGASCGSTTFIYNLSLNKKINYFLDDEKIRNKLYSPHSNIQVFNFNYDLIKKLDAILVVSWRYEKIIFKKFMHKIKLKKSKKNKQVYWIVPFPNLKIKKIRI
tara:strand:+ start:501 stop:1766 length:1266 start_codon:yes stop_codon:yes gene_type:complete